MSRRCEGVADSGNLADDVTDLLVACGDAARDRGDRHRARRRRAAVRACRGAVGFDRGDPPHQPAQPSGDPTGAGLPQLRALVGEAKSYAERLFDFPEIGSLGAEDARTALALPPRRVAPGSTTQRSTSWSSDPTGTRTSSRSGDTTSGTRRRRARSPPMDVERAAPRVQDQLDQNFFLVRLDRLTPREREYLVAMAAPGRGRTAPATLRPRWACVSSRSRRAVQRSSPKASSTAPRTGTPHSPSRSSTSSSSGWIRRSDPAFALPAHPGWQAG